MVEFLEYFDIYLLKKYIIPKTVQQIEIIYAIDFEIERKVNAYTKGELIKSKRAITTATMVKVQNISIPQRMYRR